VQIAERFGTTPGVAAAILSEKGVLPIDLGRGRGKGLRWYSQAVEIVLRQMHDEAQAKVVRKPVRLPRCGLVQGRSANELYAELTGSGKLQ
jgi:hypothetical protein